MSLKYNVLGNSPQSGSPTPAPGLRRLLPAIACMMPALAAAAAPPVPQASTRELYRQVEAFWSAEIGALGGKYRPAALVFFGQPPDHACGSDGVLRGPFYCPSSETVYLDLRFLQHLAERAPGTAETALGYIVAHELAHHVQNIIGTTALVEQARARSNPTLAARTLTSFELQADCYAGLWLHWAQQHGQRVAPDELTEALAAIAASSQQLQSHLASGEQMLDPLTHGTPALRLNWLRRGLEHGDFNACDTFGAEAGGSH